MSSHSSRSSSLIGFVLLLALLFAVSTIQAQYTTFHEISDATEEQTDTFIGAFGGSATAIGDLDGDGVTDLAVGAPTTISSESNTQKGAVWILFLNADGTVKAKQKISDTDGNFTGELVDNALFGQSVALLNVPNESGFLDLAVGSTAPNLNSRVWILRLNPDGTVKNHVEITESELSAYTIGYGLAALGDLDGDGVNDLAAGGNLTVGASGNTVWILFLNPDGTVRNYQMINDTEGGFTGIRNDGDGFGYNLAALDDLDGDGTTDLAVSASGDADGGTARGAVWILFLNSDGTVKAHQKISDTEGGFTGMLDDGDWFGSSVDILGDLDNDGVPELGVGAVGDTDGETDPDDIQIGAVWVLYLTSAGTVKRHEKISDTQGNFPGQLDSRDGFGSSIAALGDLNGDGVSDMAVGAPRGESPLNEGSVWVLFRQNPRLIVQRFNSDLLAIGDTATISLGLGSMSYPVHDIQGIGAELTYDPTLFKVTDVIAGAFLDDGDLFTFTDIDTTNGVAAFSATRKRGQPGASGNGTVFRLRARVLDTDPAGTLALQDAFAIGTDGSSFVPRIIDLALPLYSTVVWPGDTDIDGDVDLADLLRVGVFFGLTGPERQDQGFDWSSKGLIGTWSTPDVAHADALGTGKVTQNDLLPIGFNLGQTRTVPERQKSGPTAAAAKHIADVPFRLRVYHNRRKQQARARLVLPAATDLLGTAVTLTYDPNVYSFRSHQPGGLIDDGDLLSLDDKQVGSIAVAYTRKAPNGSVSGRGPVLDVLFDVIGEPHDEAMMLQSLTLGTTAGSIAVVGPDAAAARAELGLDTLPAEPVVAKAEEEAPVAFALQGAYPNPFNPATTIAFDLPERAEVSLIVVDLLGREVRRLDLGSVASGANQTVRFAADGLPSGVYLYRLEARTAEALHTATGQVTLLR